MIIRCFIMERFLERIAVSRFRDNLIIKGGILVSAVTSIDFRATMDIFSTDDVITPSAIKFNYQLMFENRSILLHTYNLETLICEKIQTVLARGLANTRLRDFYDLYILADDNICTKNIDYKILKSAFVATCNKRCYSYDADAVAELINKIANNNIMAEMWNTYCKKSYYIIDNIPWILVVENVKKLLDEMYID